MRSPLPALTVPLGLIAVGLVTWLASAVPASGDEPPKKPDAVVPSQELVDPLNAGTDACDQKKRQEVLSPWFAEAVVLKSLGTDLFVDGKPVSTPEGRVFHTFFVERSDQGENGERLWIKSGPLQGWVSANEVILIDKAHDFFTEQIRLHPKSVEAFYLRGSLDHETNLADLNEAIRLDPRFVPAYLARAALESSREKPERAIADLSEAIQLEPDRTQTYLLRASEYEGTHQLDRALADYETILRINPRELEAYAGRAAIHSAKKEWDQSIVDLTEAIRLSENDPAQIDRETLFACRARAHSHQSDHDHAIADYTEAIRLAELQKIPELEASLIFGCLYNRANAYASKQDHRRAIDEFTEMIVRFSNEKFAALAFFGRGRSREHRQDHNGALADYAEAIRRDAHPVAKAVAYLNRANIESDRNDVDVALADADRGVEALPKDPLVYVLRAQILNGNDRYDRALADCGQAVELDPKQIWGQRYRAWIRATCPDSRFRDGPKAVEEATLVCKLSDWKETGSLSTLAAAKAEVGDFDSAIQWQRKALELATDDETRTGCRERLDLYSQKRPFRDVRPADGNRRASLPSPEFPLTAL